MDGQFLEDIEVLGATISYWLTQGNKKEALQAIKDMREYLNKAESEISE